MSSSISPDSVAPASVASAGAATGAQPGLYDVFRVGSAMFERPSTRRTFRLAETAASEFAGCIVHAAYVMSSGHLVRYSGKEDRRLDLLVEARSGANGVLAHDGAWSFALFFRGNGKVKGAFALQADAEPSTETMALLLALAEPTGAALAAAELIDRQRRQTKELRRLGKATESSSQVMAATIVRLNAQQAIRDAIVVAAGSGGGETRIVETASTATGRPIVLQDSFGNDLALAGAGDPAVRPVGNLSVGPDPASGWRASPIRSRGETLGILGIYDPDDTRSDDIRFALDYTSATLAVELAHRRSVAEVELRLGRDLADDLVSGPEVFDALARAGALGFDLGGLHRAVLVAWETPTPNGVDVSAAVRYQLAAMRIPALVSRRPEATLAIVADGHDLSPLYGRVSAALTSPRGTIGIGGRCAASDLPRSFAEATRALRIRADSRQPLGLSNHDELGLLRILDTSEDGVRLTRYIQEWLGVLIEHDAQHRADLVRTLTAYLDSGGNYDRTAAALVIHRSTLRYRLRRIREVSGLELNDPDVRLNVHIALRARAALRDYFG
ncbi:helix-turn-helix domain-containing protein [Leifsonia sp. F6_8S_P_1B]|uniref:Helix-turn-helix domain-containing protein n=1 Tax=Leifsonia williamsii TaxID=3035919 RepID=A0ABT8KFV4_9MICO|nr:PucR family transcriptional regulator [Leifsonia williamsii]MDN4616331.1 helix-turn-helix domain-containing protein [Leifsonia williamsii]